MRLVSFGRPCYHAAVRPVAIVSAVLSFLVPGLGQLLRRGWVDAALFITAAVYLHLLITGLAGDAPGARLAGMFGGAFAVRGGTSQPTFVVMTVLTWLLHAMAAWAAWNAGRGPIDAVPDTAPVAPLEVARADGDGKSGEVV